MTKKEKCQYVCGHCGFINAKWMGKCPDCQTWNSFQLDQVISSSKTGNKISNISNELKALPINQYINEHRDYIKTGINEFDRVIGEAIIPGTLILVGGEPGIGKSTILLQITNALLNQTHDQKALYVSGEESCGQVAERASRLGINNKNIFLCNENNWENIEAEIKNSKPSFMVIDSIQTIYSHNNEYLPGSPGQIKEMTYNIMNFSKANDLTTFIIGHINKDGNIAGPKLLEHMVDVVIYFEGDNSENYRILRSVKNRFGNCNEVGLFEMAENGLKEISNPSQCFVTKYANENIGHALCCLVEGTRNFFIEIQSLVLENKHGNGRRNTQLFDNNRLSMLLAVLEKYIGLSFSFTDVYLNVIGGFKVVNREADLAVCASVISSYKNIPLPSDVVFLGEIGLGGEIRKSFKIEKRLQEIKKYAYKKCVISLKDKELIDATDMGIEVIGIQSVKELSDFLNQYSKTTTTKK
jgi:DNA repair protein RadA/Sms